MWLFVPRIAVATTLSVGPGGDYATLSEAADAAQPGDVIEVGPGAYTASIRIVRPDVTIRGAGQGATVLSADPGAADPTLHLAFATGFRVEDLTLTGAPTEQALRVEDAQAVFERVSLSSGASDDRFGALVEANHSDLLFVDSTFSGVGALGRQGGILHADACSVTVVNGVFQQGTASKFGGAVSLEDSDATFVGSTFADNHARSGGAIDFDGGPGNVLHIEDSTFAGNVADDAIKGQEGFGGALVAFGGSVTIERSTFAANEATYGGGAVDLSFTHDTLVQDSTFTANTAGRDGGAIALYRPVDVRVRRNVFDDNASAYLGGALLLGGSGTVDVQGNRFCESHAEVGAWIASNAWNGTMTTTVRNNIAIQSASINTGSALLMWGSSVLTLENNVVAHSTSADDLVRITDSGRATITNNAFVSNLGSSFDVDGEGQLSTSHNLHWNNDQPPPADTTQLLVDPVFDGDASGCLGSYRPSEDSPMVDAGSDTLTDVDGSVSDIGAYGGPGALVWDLDGDGVIDDDCAPLDPARSAPDDCVDPTPEPTDGTEPTEPDIALPAPAAPRGWFCGHTGGAGTSWLLAAVLGPCAATRRRRRSRST
ncbi:MAG: right-handed parallel beta-helix repeat-containing protein [Myxococcales bacterium]|nr:right-handed parallel beta-helix repeat-containing protein [Myxococcales bacterium]